MRKKKPCGYFWKIRKMMKKNTKQGDEIKLENYPKRAQDYIIKIWFTDLPLVNVTINKRSTNK